MSRDDFFRKEAGRRYVVPADTTWNEPAKPEPKPNYVGPVVALFGIGALLVAWPPAGAVAVVLVMVAMGVMSARGN